jgi:hypothetical protein
MLQGLGDKGEVAPRGYQLAHVQAPVRIKVVEHPVIAGHGEELLPHVRQMCREVLTGPCRAEMPQYLPRGHHEVGRGGPPSGHPRLSRSLGGGRPAYSSRVTGHQGVPRGEKRRGRPGRGASWRPVSPWVKYRAHHRRTVWRSQRIAAASRRLDGWSEAASRQINRQRHARA